MKEEDVIKKELILAKDNNQGPISSYELYERTGLSPTQLSNGIKTLLLNKKIKETKKNTETFYQKY